MVRKNIKNTLIYKELEADGEKYFGLTDKKFIHNIDTFYFSVFIENDNNEFKNMGNLDLMLKKMLVLKEMVVDGKEDVYYYEDIGLLVQRGRHKIYDIKLGIPNLFDIFFCSYLPNNKTPRVVIQLRSIGIWTEGIENIINKSFSVLLRIFQENRLVVDRVQENRIDYCYHTNYIQNPSDYFTDNVIANNIDSPFDIGNKVFRKNKKELEVNYLSLGQRASNSIFFRIYNKTREVIEEKYKDFFFDKWFENGLISFYDKFCLEYAYKQGTSRKGSYKQLEWAKLEFYLKYGKRSDIKKDIELLKRDYSTNLDHVRKYTKNILPEVTTIINIEYQTMRRFYYQSDSVIQSLNTFSEFNPRLKRLYQVIDNRKLFLDYLTWDSVAFKRDNYDIIEKNLSKSDIDIKDKEKYILMDWWYRLRNTKVCSLNDAKFKRDYSRNLNLEMLTQKLKGVLASISLYSGFEDTEINEDFAAALCVLNDNDVKNDVVFVNRSTGEYIELQDGTYDFLKEKKKKSLGNLIAKSSQGTSNDNN